MKSEKTTRSLGVLIGVLDDRGADRDELVTLVKQIMDVCLRDDLVGGEQT